MVDGTPFEALVEFIGSPQYSLQVRCKFLLDILGFLKLTSVESYQLFSHMIHRILNDDTVDDVVQKFEYIRQILANEVFKNFKFGEEDIVNLLRDMMDTISDDDTKIDSIPLFQCIQQFLTDKNVVLPEKVKEELLYNVGTRIIEDDTLTLRERVHFIEEILKMIDSQLKGPIKSLKSDLLGYMVTKIIDAKTIDDGTHTTPTTQSTRNTSRTQRQLSLLQQKIKYIRGILTNQMRRSQQQLTLDAKSHVLLYIGQKIWDAFIPWKDKIILLQQTAKLQDMNPDHPGTVTAKDNLSCWIVKKTMTSSIPWKDKILVFSKFPPRCVRTIGERLLQAKQLPFTEKLQHINDIIAIPGITTDNKSSLVHSIGKYVKDHYRTIPKEQRIQVLVLLLHVFSVLRNHMDDKNTAVLQQMNQKIKTDTEIPRRARKQLLTQLETLLMVDNYEYY